MEEIIEKAQWRYSSGVQFEEAFYLLIADFDVITNTWKNQIESPSYYCGGFAVEQFLKSFLILKQVVFLTNHKGHDLMNLISLDKKKLMEFFELDEADILQISILNERYYNNEAYGKDDLRYASKTGLRRSPHPDNLNRIIKKMDKKLSTEISKQCQSLKT